MERINQFWVGLYSDTDTFRKHEWEKHGTCYTPYSVNSGNGP